MTSPFPGMDPYLEAPEIWPDFHDSFAGEIRGVLNQILPAPYYAQLEYRPEIGVINPEEGTSYQRRIVPDVGVLESLPPQGNGGVAVVATPRTTLSPWIEIEAVSEPGRHAYVEIRDPRRHHRLVSLIEIVSPSNKRPGVDRQAYVQKFREVYDSDASLIEIDLLRDGERILHFLPVTDAVAAVEPPLDYLVLVNRAWKRPSGVLFQVFPIRIREMLPVVAVPLREGEPEVPLDLQYVFNRTYDGGPYRRGAVNYNQLPQPPLRHADADWALQRLREKGYAPALNPSGANS